MRATMVWAITAAVVATGPIGFILWGMFFKKLDKRWYRKHPGQSRTPAADAPLVEYRTEQAPEYMRGIDKDGNPIPEPPIRKIYEL